jgi:hypothetical protein
MSTPVTLLGLGLPVYIANLVGTQLVSATSQGAAIGSATTIPGANTLMYTTTSNSGSGFVLPAVTGDVNKANVTDRVVVANLQAGSVVVYGATTAQGSATTIFISGNSVTGTTGASVATGSVVEFFPISVSSWVGIRSA